MLSSDVLMYMQTLISFSFGFWTLEDACRSHLHNTEGQKLSTEDKARGPLPARGSSRQGCVSARDTVTWRWESREHWRSWGMTQSTRSLLFATSWGCSYFMSWVLSKLTSVLLQFLEQQLIIPSLQKAYGQCMRAAGDPCLDTWYWVLQKML